jgi:hypothetical protein
MTDSYSCTLLKFQRETGFRRSTYLTTFSQLILIVRMIKNELERKRSCPVLKSLHDDVAC